MKYFALLLCVLLAGCAAIEEENSSTEPIPPERPGPFDSSMSSGASIRY